MEVTMPEEVKFTEEELKQVQNIQASYQNVQNQFGQLKMAQIRLDNQEVELEDALKQIQGEEQKFLDGITDKYGQGTLNPETGVFTPAENKSE
jgi:predicted nuclease with TOPRIM domain